MFYNKTNNFLGLAEWLFVVICPMSHVLISFFIPLVIQGTFVDMSFFALKLCMIISRTFNNIFIQIFYMSFGSSAKKSFAPSAVLAVMQQIFLYENFSCLLFLRYSLVFYDRNFPSIWYQIANFDNLCQCGWQQN